MTEPIASSFPGEPLSDAGFDQLCLRYCLGDIEPQDFERLCVALDRDSARRSAFVQISMQVETLRQAFETQHEELASLSEAEESADILNEIIQTALISRKRSEVERQAAQQLAADHARRRAEEQKTKADQDERENTRPRVLVIPKAVVWGAIAATILLAALVTVYLPDDSPPSPAQAPVASANTIGHMVGSIDAAWSSDGLSPVSDGGLMPGMYQLTRGAVELKLGRGAKVVIQSPCTFELVEDNLARVERGRWVATVPPSATGFTIESGQVRVVDLGTEFGVEVNAAGVVTTSVFKGEVVVGSRLDDVPSVSIKAGQAAVADITGQVGSAQPISSLLQPIVFARTLEDAARSPDQRYADSVLADRPLLYWRFEELAQGKVINSDGTGRPEGVIVGNVGIDQGVFGRGARFNGHVSGVARIESRGGMLGGVAAAYTIEMWIKPDLVHYGRIASLMGETQTGEISNTHLGMLEILGDRDWLEAWATKTEATTDRSLRFYHRSPLTASVESGQNLWPSQRYRAGQWMLITAVKTEQQLELFLDGQRIAQAPDQQGVTGPVLLMLGSHIVGWGREDVSSRTFAGVIDEVAVYDHALDAGRIATRYRLGLELLQRPGNQSNALPKQSLWSNDRRLAGDWGSRAGTWLKP